MSFVPALAAFFIHVAATGWFTVGFDPMRKITSAFITSRTWFETAPELMPSISAATLEAWQSRVQWSTLFEPKPVRTPPLLIGGEAIGVIPKDLMDKGLGLATVTSLRIVETIHARKALMAELADAFIAMPGGFGTAEEFFEALTWAQLGLHTKPCGLLNVCAYYRHLVEFMDYAVKQDFLKPKHRALLIVEEEVGALLDRFDDSIATRAPKPFDPSQT